MSVTSPRSKIPRRCRRSDLLVRRYLAIKHRLIAEGWGHEIDWQDRLHLNVLTEQDFLRECAWVILSSGMAERVIRAKFPQISDAFHNWKGARLIRRNAVQCRRRALKAFGHRGKIDAILQVATSVGETGFKKLKCDIAAHGPDFLESFPYVGPVTAFHLAKNIGLDVAKPDRHLVRIARITGFDCAFSLCARIAELVGDRVAVVDLVLWRFATQEPKYRQYFLAS